MRSIIKRSLGWAAVVVVALSVGAGHAVAERPARPNILLIVADDLGWSDVGWHGGFGKTPNLDRLVREGVELDRFYVQPQCTPTRAALLSGRQPGRFGPHALGPSNRRALPPGTVTLASSLKSLGYATYQVGKWHLGSRPEWGPNAYGFDESYGTLTGAADPWTHKYRAGPYEDTWHRNGQLFDEEGNATELVADQALRWIRGEGGEVSSPRQPWFLYVPFHAVHTPVDTPPDYKKLYEGMVFHDDPAKQDSRLRIAAMVSQVDAKVGAFVEALEASGQRNNTLVIFLSDNGGIESLKNAYIGDVADSPLNSENDPLRGQKAQLYEGGIRVCGFVNWPGVLAPRVCRSPMHAVDWLPTIAGLVGFAPETDPQWDGVDRWEAIAGPEDQPRPKPIFIRHRAGEAVLAGPWKLVLMPKQPPQLFAINDDPYETTDLASEQPAVVARLTAAIEKDGQQNPREVPADLIDFPN